MSDYISVEDYPYINVQYQTLRTEIWRIKGDICRGERCAVCFLRVHTRSFKNSKFNLSRGKRNIFLTNNCKNRDLNFTIASACLAKHKNFYPNEAPSNHRFTGLTKFSLCNACYISMTNHFKKSKFDERNPFFNYFHDSTNFEVDSGNHSIEQPSYEMEINDASDSNDMEIENQVQDYMSDDEPYCAPYDPDFQPSEYSESENSQSSQQGCKKLKFFSFSFGSHSANFSIRILILYLY